MKSEGQSKSETGGGVKVWNLVYKYMSFSIFVKLLWVLSSLGLFLL